MVVCRNGHPLEPRHQFCPRCGEAVATARCPNGHDTDPSFRFCPECGDALNHPANEHTATPAPDESSVYHESSESSDAEPSNAPIRKSSRNVADWLRGLTQGQLMGLIALAMFALIGFSAIVMQFEGSVPGSRVSTVGECYDQMEPELTQILTDQSYLMEVLRTAIEEDDDDMNPEFRALAQTAFYVADRPMVSEYEAMNVLRQECEYHFGSL